MADNTPTLHHMDNSQSQRILWLLEELQIPYHLQLHYRNPPTHPSAPFLSPDSLKAIGAYGKAPVLITGLKDGNRLIPETSAIATYLIKTFDSNDKFGLRNGDWIRDEVLTSVIQTNLSKATSNLIMLDFNVIANGAGPGGKKFDGPELRKVLGELERELKSSPEGGYFAGRHPGRADIMLEFPLAMISQRRWVDVEREFPGLWEWLQRCYGREAWKRGLKKGNGYDLTVFPKRPHLSL